MAIEFPSIDPVAFSLGPIDVRWYALAYIAGFVLGWKYCVLLVARLPLAPHMPDREMIDDLLAWIILGVIVGGRLGYILFYQLDFYAANPEEMIKLWRGGMSFHGGLLGAGAAIYLFSLRKGVSFWVLFDLVAAAAPIGLFFGRIANFVNGELYGRVTDVSWGVIFPSGGDIPRHPSQLYEAIFEGAVLWFLLFLFIIYYNALVKNGLLTGLFLCGYSLARFTIEFFRMPDEEIGLILDYLSMGQILSVPMFGIGCAFIYIAYTRDKEPEEADRGHK